MERYDEEKEKVREEYLVERRVWKVMSDEQMELLRKQICVYTIICDNLVQMHKLISVQRNLSGGIRMGNLYYDPMMAYPNHRMMSSRQRWTPTSMQLQILEHLYSQCNGTPSKQRIKDITTKLLSPHGPISETNVYNWFQNRRARSKRKHNNILRSSSHQSQSNPVDNQPVSVSSDLKENKNKQEESSVQSFESSSSGYTIDAIFFQPPDLGIDHLFAT